MIKPPEITFPIGTVLTSDKGHVHVFLGYTENTRSTDLHFFNTHYLGSSVPMIYHAVSKETILRKFPGAEA